jgi:hypothetical protein
MVFQPSISSGSKNGLGLSHSARRAYTHLCDGCERKEETSRPVREIVLQAHARYVNHALAGKGSP